MPNQATLIWHKKNKKQKQKTEVNQPIDLLLLSTLNYHLAHWMGGMVNTEVVVLHPFDSKTRAPSWYTRQLYCTKWYFLHVVWVGKGFEDEFPANSDLSFSVRRVF
jgi:hypothetical protein